MHPSEKIKELRMNMGLTQKQLAEKVGVVQSMIAMIETGQKNPSFDLAQKIADVFGVDMNEIWGKDYDYDDLPADVRILLRNIADGGLTKKQISAINQIINQFREVNKKTKEISSEVPMTISFDRQLEIRFAALELHGKCMFGNKNPVDMSKVIHHCDYCITCMNSRLDGVLGFTAYFRELDKYLIVIVQCRLAFIDLSAFRR